MSMVFSPSIFQHLLWVLHTTLGSNPVAMGVIYTVIHHKNPLHLEYQKELPTNQQFFLWRDIPCEPNLPMKYYHSFASLPHLYSLSFYTKTWFFTSPKIQATHHQRSNDGIKLRCWKRQRFRNAFHCMKIDTWQLLPLSPCESRLEPW